MDAMSDAIEGADVMLYGVSLKYKESANVSASVGSWTVLDANVAAADLGPTHVWVGAMCLWLVFAVSIGGCELLAVVGLS